MRYVRRTGPDRRNENFLRRAQRDTVRPVRRGLQEARARGVRVDPGEAVDAFGDGWIVRDKRGFAPCAWAFDLARFTPARPGDRVLDLGCGGGALLLALGQVHPDLGPRLGVELDPHAADQAARNARLAASAYAVVRGDVRALPAAPRAFDLVVSNPPFYPAGWGRQSEDARVAGATHALAGDVGDFARAAAGALSPHGRAVFVYDAGHLPALLLALDAAGLTVRALRFLDDDRGLPARVLALAGRGAGLVLDRRRQLA
jgi:tRNA1(Val) A37 N6-methylase TrmN6